MQGDHLGFDRTADRGTLGIPALALGMWSPLWVGVLRWNSQLYEANGTIASEWQHFVSGRVRQHFAVMQRVAHCRTPDQVCAAFGEFWQKAIEDYGREYLVMGRLVAGVMSKSVAAAQSAAEEESSQGLRASRLG